ncbi:M60 family metallopeptidase [Catellicoccus marimammalium]|uniref:Peptidase M60 domain-containing protein n=1 Tax=Catellicoccus marimammalium M35/04/3 TaxID=1234409 RepID=K8ZN02_9ENTE|nr:M60 family metallopeptidase [Catellicoccus marimammalium]EKU26976.1 hypothetical protein C683_0972 [Catellicoccus marimammalium M35/04/3]
MKKKIPITAASLMGLLFAPAVMEAEAKDKSKSLYSEHQAPEIYGTKKAIVHQSDKISIIDPRYRVLAMDFEDGDLTNKIQLVSIDNNQDYHSLIDAKTGELKNLSLGKHTLLYRVTDKHGNTTEFTTEIDVKEDSKEHSKDTIEKTIRSAPYSGNTMNTLMKRGDEHDRQMLGIQLDPGQGIDIKIKDRPSGGGNLYVDIMTDGNKKDVYHQQINGNSRHLRAKTIDEASNIKGTKDPAGVPFISTPRNNYEQGSDARPYTVEYTVGHEARRLPYYHTGDNQELFFNFWEKETKAHRREVKLNNNKSEVRDTGYAVLEGQHHLMLIPANTREEIKKRFAGERTLDDLNTEFVRLFKQYDTFVGLELDPEDRINQRTYTKYYMRPDQNGLPGSAAYYVSPWIAQTGDKMTWFSTMGWGTFHEIGHGYQGRNHVDTIDYMEVTNNILAYYAQHNEKIAGKLNSYWMDMDKDAEGWQKHRMNALKSRLPGSEGEVEINEMRWRLYAKGMDVKARLFFFLNMLESLNPKNPSEPWGKVNEQIRIQKRDTGNTDTIPNQLLRAFYEKYGVDITPYLIEWGTNRPLSNKKNYDMQRNGDQMVQLRDVVYNKEKLKEITSELGVKEYGLVRTSDLIKRNVEGKAKIRLKVSDEDMEKLKGKKILLYNKGKIVKEVTIGDSKDIDVKIPVGAYAVEFPKIYDGDDYKYTYEMPYVFSTDQEVDQKAKTTFPQYYTSCYYKKEKKKTLSKDSMVVLGKDSKSKEVSAISATIYPDEKHGRSELKFKINNDAKVVGKTTVSLYTQLVPNTDYFLSAPDVVYTAEKDGKFTRTDGRKDNFQIADNDILAITTTDDNYQNVRNYSETGKEYEFNRPKTETTYYRMSNKGFREAHLKPIEVEDLLYQQEKLKTLKELESKVNNLPEDFYSSRNDYAPLKSEIIALYNKLKGEDQKKYQSIVEQIQQGGKPQINWKSAKSADEKLVVSDNRVNDIDWYNEISVIDPEDGRVPKDKIKISEDTKRWTTPDEYKIHVKATDMDGNTSEQDLTVQVVPEKDFEESHTKECEKQIDALDFLDSEEKSQAKEQLKKAYTATDLKEVVTKAKSANDIRVVDAQNKVMEHLSKYKDLSGEEQEKIQSALKQCQTKEEMKNLHTKVKKDVETRIQKEYDNSLQKLDECSEITDSEKEKVKEKLKETTTRDDMKKIMVEVEKENHERQLKDKESIFQSLCKNYKDLSDSEKDAIKLALDQATTKEQWQEIRKEVIEKVETRLQKEYENSIKAIESLDKLSSDERAETIAALEKSQTRKEMQTIVKKATDENNQRKEEVESGIKEQIQQMKDLSPQEKEEVFLALDKLSSKEEMEAILSVVKEKVKQRVEHAYLLAQQQISAFGFLPKEKQEELEAKLKQVESREEIAKIVKEATQENETQKEAEQNKVIDMIQNSSLSEEEKADWVQKVEAATSKEELEEIKETVDKVEEENKDQWQEQKEQLIKELSYYSFLTTKEKNIAKEAILQSKSLESLNHIRKTLQKVEQERLNQGKEELTEAILKENALSTEAKEYFLAQLKDARTKEALEQIQKEAWKLIADKENQLHPLKAQVKEWIEKNSFLTDTEKLNAQRKLNALQSEKAIYHFAEELQDKTKEIRKVLEEKMRDGIQALTFLSKEDKAYYIQFIYQAQDKRTMESIFSYAKEMNRYYEGNELNKKQRELKARIQRLTLPTEEKEKLLQKVIDAKYLAELEMIEGSIQSAEKEYLEKQKQEVEKELASYQLTTEQRQSLLHQLEKAQSEVECKEIIQKAKEYHKENTKPKFHKDHGYVTFKNNHTTIWNDVFLEKERSHSSKYLGQILKVKGFYIIQGQKYYTLYTSDNQWIGYVKASELNEMEDPWTLRSTSSFKVKVNRKNYTIWRNLSFKVKKSDTNTHYKKVYKVKRTYYHFNGYTYYSLYDHKDQWVGYVNKDAVVKK